MVMNVGELSSNQLATLLDNGETLCVLPVGATEQHGAHLPLATDTLLAEAFCAAAAERTGVPVLPAVAFGASRAHTGKWAGTLALSPQLLIELVVEVATWVAASGFTKLLIVNSHVGNRAPLAVAVDEIRHRGILRTAAVDWFGLSADISAVVTADAADWHANAAETSLLMYLRPDLVDAAAISDDPDRTADLVFAYSVAETSADGVTGAPSEASAEAGEQLFSTVVDALAQLIERARREAAPNPAAEAALTYEISINP